MFFFCGLVAKNAPKVIWFGNVPRKRSGSAFLAQENVETHVQYLLVSGKPCKGFAFGEAPG